ncbi:MAG TPA: efflux transporter outer membrane subunit [Rhodopila sp.]|jgi:NodT family efflux transporter outer membrane factor (OMF) lipoprotein|nr:efflux transporter outer membrane subunit [Rhodopila sp.]
MINKSKRELALLTAVLGATALTGCTVGPDFKHQNWASPGSWFAGPKEAVALPPSIPVAEPVDVDWWHLFGDPVLTGLEKRVAAENLDVKAAGIRLAESRAQLGIARASLFPTVGANTSYVREKASDNGLFALIPSAAGADAANGSPTNSTGGVSGSGLKPFDLYQGGFDASWEVDLWGGVRRSVESATATSEAAKEEERGVLLSSLAEVARDYIDLRGVQADLEIARENVRTARQSLDLTQQRAAGGVTTDLDVANASAQVRTTQATIPSLEQREAQSINALSLLLGQPPNALRNELATAKPVPPVPPRVPVGLPSELARRRPDIRQADAQLHAATAEIGVAQADFYPSLNLTGSVGLQALQFSNVFNLNSRQYAMGPGLTIPIFQGGQLRSTLQLRKAQQQEAAVNFQKTVLQAWHDVDNAMTAYQTEQNRRKELIQAVAENRRALSLAQSRYSQGVADFLSVLDAERNLLGTQLQLADSTTAVSSNLVALYKALGGGWETDMPEETAAAK